MISIINKRKGVAFEWIGLIKGFKELKRSIIKEESNMKSRDMFLQDVVADMQKYDSRFEELNMKRVAEGKSPLVKPIVDTSALDQIIAESSAAWETMSGHTKKMNIFLTINPWFMDDALLEKPAPEAIDRYYREMWIKVQCEYYNTPVTFLKEVFRYKAEYMDPNYYTAFMTCLCYIVAVNAYLDHGIDGSQVDTYVKAILDSTKWYLESFNNLYISTADDLNDLISSGKIAWYFESDTTPEWFLNEAV